MTNHSSKSVTSFVDSEYKSYSRYVLESRAIPNVIDGLKPSQRKILYTANKTARGKLIKTASLSGNVISQANYHHGDASLNAAISAMVQPFSNNIPLLRGEGNFGSRLVTEPAAARYTFAGLSKDFDKYFLDNEILLSSFDPEDPEPQFYLPIIPWVLVNGIKGIAIGYATEIQPRDPKLLKRLCIDVLNGKDISRRKMLPHYPDFKGTITEEDGKYICRGVFERVGRNKLIISEIPVGTDRERYVKILDKLEETNHIQEYIDQCDKSGFKFEVTIRNLNKMTDEQIIRHFKLERSLNDNLTTIDECGRLKIFETPQELLKYFVDYRLTQYTRRYDYYVQRDEDEKTRLGYKKNFIEAVINGDITFRNRTKDQLKSDLDDIFIPEEYHNWLLNIPAYSFCEDELDKLRKTIKSLEKDIKTWKSTDITEAFISDLS